MAISPGPQPTSGFSMQFESIPKWVKKPPSPKTWNRPHLLKNAIGKSVWLYNICLSIHASIHKWSQSTFIFIILTKVVINIMEKYVFYNPGSQPINDMFLITFSPSSRLLKNRWHHVSWVQNQIQLWVWDRDMYSNENLQRSAAAQGKTKSDIKVELRTKSWEDGNAQ